MKKITIGILAHVDAGKTTLTESMLLKAGVIRDAGRVDHGDAFLDTESLEKQRGVTIISKQAQIKLSQDNELNRSKSDVEINIIDTPGHTDFVGETERAISVLDMAILVISATDGVTGSTRRLVDLMKHYRVPYMIYVNKMDLSVKIEEEILESIRDDLGIYADGIPFDTEYVAGITESLIEKYFETGEIEDGEICALIEKGKFHPVIFGSALKNIGADKLLSLITQYLPDKKYPEDFGARIYKLTYENGRKLAFAKITGGSIHVRDVIGEEKITEIRQYNGGSYIGLQEAVAGDVVTFVGLEDAFIGKGLGFEVDDTTMLVRPLLRYIMVLPPDVSVRSFLPSLKELSLEDPLLGSLETEGDDRIYISVMGDFQLEILAEKIFDRFGVRVSFTEGRVIYKETIKEPVMGFGHFEPLRHYSEVHILMEPLPAGSGIQIGSALSVNELGIQFQKTVLSTMARFLPRGVLTRSELTDMRLTLVAGRSHTKHSNSEDFREAARRAIRQGLMKAENVLLEPYMNVRFTVPSETVGRIFTDVEQMGGSCEIEGLSEKTGKTRIMAKAPAKAIGNYQAELVKFTSDEGDMEFLNHEYRPSPDQEKTVEEIGYDAERDTRNPSSSVFCSHGAGEVVSWDLCEERMHVESREGFYLRGEISDKEDELKRKSEILKKQHERQQREEESRYSLGTDEVDEILRNATHSNEGNNKRTKRVYFEKNRYAGASTASGSSHKPKPVAAKPPFLLVDGYNMIYAWNELKSLVGSSEEMEGARFKLLEIMSEYASMKASEVMVVFDAYKVKGHFTTYMNYMGVHVIFTKEAETADQYITKYTRLNAKDFDITVATSDHMIQLFVLGEDSKIMSAASLEADIKNTRNEIMSYMKPEIN